LNPRGRGGGGVFPIMAFTGRLRRKGIALVQASGLQEGKDFTSWGIEKGREIGHLCIYKGF